MDDVLVLDRDGVINVDLMTYVTRPEDFEPIKGSLEAIAPVSYTHLTLPTKRIV